MHGALEVCLVDNSAADIGVNDGVPINPLWEVSAIFGRLDLSDLVKIVLGSV